MKTLFRLRNVWSLLFVVLLLQHMTGYSQVPQKFNYQGIARDAKGNPLVKQTMSLKLSVLPTADASAPEYEELQTVTTNEFGLYTLQIGSGTAIKGDMKSVQWETGNKYIQVAIDPAGGNNFTQAGTTQLLSVPYAIYAEKAGMAKNGAGDRTGTVTSNAAHVVGDANFVTKFTALNVIGKSRLFDNGTSVAIGTASPDPNFTFHLRRTTSGGHILMENPTPTGFGTFRMFNDNPSNFATFTKYGSAVAGGYSGIAALYPFANMLGYGNNGPFLNAGTGNIGFAITKAGTNKLKIHIDAASEKVGIGGNSVPAAQVHINNTDGVGDTLKLTDNTTGHTAGDGLNLLVNGTAAKLTNMEGGSLSLGTNNTDRVTISSTGLVGVNVGSPSSLLHLKGNNNGFDAGLRLEDDATADFGSILGGQEGLIYHSRTAGNDHLFLTNANGSVSSPAMIIKDNGNVGVGTNAPIAQLDVTGAGSTSTTNNLILKNSNGDTLLRMRDDGRMGLGYNGSYGRTLNLAGTGMNYYNANNEFGGAIFAQGDTSLVIWSNSGSTDRLSLQPSWGKVVIGSVSSTPGAYKLYVDGGILTERLKVAVSGSANWADYVFADDYKLMPLEEVEAFVKENKHLPNVPSADNMVETGIDVATVDAKLMEKIEELTLYLIDMKKEINALKAENEIMKANLKK